MDTCITFPNLQSCAQNRIDYASNQSCGCAKPDEMNLVGRIFDFGRQDDSYVKRHTDRKSPSNATNQTDWGHAAIGSFRNSPTKSFQVGIEKTKRKCFKLTIFENPFNVGNF